MNQNTKTSLLKRLVGFSHFFFACIAFTGIGFMYLNGNYGRGISWVKEEAFEQSPDFNKKVQGDITSIFDYIQYQEIFETNGEVDYNKVVLETSSGPDASVSYTLNDIILYAKSLGYYLDEADHYALKGSPENLTEEDKEQLYVLYRCYQSEEELTGPDQSFASLPDLTYEILRRFSSYYSIYSRLMSDFTNFYFRVAFYSNNNAIYEIHTNAPEMSIDSMMALGKYVYYAGDSTDLVVRTNFDSTFPSIPAMMAKNNPYNGNQNYIVIGLDTSYKANDDYAQEFQDYTSSRRSFINGIYLLAVGLTGCFLTLCFLLFASGHQSLGDKTISLYPFDKIRTDFMLLIMAFVTWVCIRFAAPFTAKLTHLVVSENYWIRANRIMTFAFLYFCGLLTFFSLLRRYKAETLWKNSFLYDLTEALSESTFKFRLTVGFVVYLSGNVFLITLAAFLILQNEEQVFRSAPFIATMAAWIVGNLLVFYYLYCNSEQTDRLHEAIDRIASGETSYKVDTTKFSSLEAGLAEGLNRISDGLETALAEQVKGERLKADLITNVSHDIKTPLTSIINYVDLIKREHIEDPKIQKYLEVLDQKSQRLKTLTEDLVEASKASSGNMNLEITDIDIVELVQQTNGEFEEKYALKRLELVNTLPNEVIIIEADGRRLWRVLENLYNNAFKYALENTRVYVGIEDRGSEVAFSIKNVSASALNISPDELTERFVRGDVSRTTEGSGLGLSIAKDLTQLQGGNFKLTIDGDLFKAEVLFPIKN
ncbi:MAG: HAMP domain-containing histidine kinase [Lachnospiraceae bacterium]|nr:HAMP domain-containing histidine kinase [Lachnospiraceae bacterium]